MSSLAVPFVRLADHEHVPVVGQLETIRWRAAWAGDGVTIIDRELDKTALEVSESESVSVQMSRSMRLVQPGWLMRSLGHEVVEEHRLHLVLRSLFGARVHLSAVVDRVELLEGLPTLDNPPHDVPLAALTDLLVTVLAMGGRVAYASDLEAEDAADRPAPPVVIAGHSDDVIAAAARHQRRDAGPVPVAPKETPAQIRAERDRLRDRLRDLEKQNVSQHVRIRALENESTISDLEVQLRAVRATLDEAQGDARQARARLEAQTRQHDMQLSELTDRLKILTAQNKELDAARETLQAHIDTRQAERDEARHKLDQAQRELEVARVKATRLEAERARLEETAGEHGGVHDGLREQLAALNETLGEEAARRKALEATIDTQRQSMAALEMRLAGGQEQLESMHARRRALEAELEAARRASWRTVDDHNVERNLLEGLDLPLIDAFCPACRQRGLRAPMFRLARDNTVGRDGLPRPADALRVHGEITSIWITTVVCTRCGHMTSLFERPSS